MYSDMWYAQHCQDNVVVSGLSLTILNVAQHCPDGIWASICAQYANCAIGAWGEFAAYFAVSDWRVTDPPISWLEFATRHADRTPAHSERHGPETVMR